MNQRIGPCVLVLGAIALAGCGGEKSEEPVPEAPRDPTQFDISGNFAEAIIDPKSGTELTGMAIFKEEADGRISIELSVENAPTGLLAAHIHELGDCSAADGTSAGGHWNPTAVDHGRWGQEPFHLGDLGNLEVGDNGLGSLFMVSDVWSMGTRKDDDIVGKAIIVHAGEDDFATQPTGAAGGRIGCGVIEKK